MVFLSMHVSELAELECYLPNAKGVPIMKGGKNPPYVEGEMPNIDGEYQSYLLPSSPPNECACQVSRSRGLISTYWEKEKMPELRVASWFQQSLASAHSFRLEKPRHSFGFQPIKLEQFLFLAIHTKRPGFWRSLPTKKKIFKSPALFCLSSLRAS